MNEYFLTIELLPSHLPVCISVDAISKHDASMKAIKSQGYCKILTITQFHNEIEDF